MISQPFLTGKLGLDTRQWHVFLTIQTWNCICQLAFFSYFKMVSPFFPSLVLILSLICQICFRIKVNKWRDDDVFWISVELHTLRFLLPAVFPKERTGKWCVQKLFFLISAHLCFSYFSWIPPIKILVVHSQNICFGALNLSILALIYCLYLLEIWWFRAHSVHAEDEKNHILY